MPLSQCAFTKRFPCMIRASALSSCHASCAADTVYRPGEAAIHVRLQGAVFQRRGASEALCVRIVHRPRAICSPKINCYEMLFLDEHKKHVQRILFDMPRCLAGPKLGWVRQADVANSGPSSTSLVGFRGMPYNSAATPTFPLALSRLQSSDLSDTGSED
jgi:hypothetical protein